MLVFFSKQKTAYEMRISDWSSDVCASDLADAAAAGAAVFVVGLDAVRDGAARAAGRGDDRAALVGDRPAAVGRARAVIPHQRLIGTGIGRASCREQGGQ